MTPSDLPDIFEYLRDCTERHGRPLSRHSEEFQQEIDETVAQLTYEDLERLLELRDEIVDLEDEGPILDWCDEALFRAHQGEADAAAYVQFLMYLLRELELRQVAPFEEQLLDSPEDHPPEPIDPATVPEELWEFVPIIERWRLPETQGRRLKWSREIRENEQAMNELRRIAQWSDEKQEAWEQWVDDVGGDSGACAEFCEMRMALYELGLKAEHYKRDWNTYWIRQLKHRRAIERAGAAQSLADRGELAASAIPVLEEATKDPDEEVRLCAHYALAVLEGSPQHQRAIQNLQEQGLEEAEDALEKLDAPEQRRNLQGLCSACILGDLENVERLAREMDVNDTNQHGIRPLELAIGNDHYPVVEILLANGAEVNQPDLHGNYPLHDAVVRPDNERIIELLLANGADPRRRTTEGLTAAQLAHQVGLEEYVTLLREAARE